MSPSQLLAILLARWRIVVAVFVAVIVVTIVVTLVKQKQYTATASVVIEVRPDPVTSTLSAITPAYMATQVDVIRSDRVAQRVVRNLRLSENPAVRNQWLAATQGEGRIEAWMAENFQRALEVKPSRESMVIEVQYKAPDPKFAAVVANAFVQAYVDTALELRVDPARQFSAFFNEQAKEARERLESAQTKLSEFQKANGIIATDERLDIENTRLAELSSQLVALQAVTVDSTSRQNQAQGSAADRMQEVLANPLVAGLRADLSRSEAKLQELSSRYGDNHPQVQEAKANIAELKLKVEQETRRVAGGLGVANSINRQREAEIRAALDAQRAKVLKMKALRDEGAVLLRDVESAQRSYDGIQSRLSQTNLESQTTTSNISILSAAEPPLQHSSPRLLMNLLVGVFVGALCGVSLALVRELTDRRLRSGDDLAVLGDLPVLGVLPGANEQPGRSWWQRVRHAPRA